MTRASTIVSRAWWGTVAAGTLLIAPPAFAQQARDSTDGKIVSRTTLDEVVVTATRSDQAIRNVPANVVVLTREAIASSSALSTPDLVRRIPGFSARDYQNPLVTHPSRSAPSFRGLGGSSAGRTLILVDGVPLNEPFSGWVHWARIPLPLVERSEVVRGGGSGVWGNRALGGVINIVTTVPQETGLQLGLEGGGLSTFRGSATGSLKQGRLSALAAGDWFDTDGFYITRSDQLGPIDRKSMSRSKVAYGKVFYDFSPTLRGYVSGNYLDESRNAGTVLQVTGTTVRELRAGLRALAPGGGVLNISAYGNHQDFSQFVSTQAVDRQTEIPALDEFDVPASSYGATIQWSQLAWRRHQLTAGADLMLIDGTGTHDFNWVAAQNRMIRRRTMGGEQLLSGVFLQDAISVAPQWKVLGGLRYDRVRNHSGLRTERDLVGGSVLLDTAYAARTESRFSYNLGFRHEASASFAWRASGYGAFRAPTLNELYKPFRESGNVVNEANAALSSERLIGVELGADLTLTRDLLVRFTAFWNRVEDPIIEATIAPAGATGRTIAPCGFVPAGGVCRQRKNVGSLRTAGLEAELEVHPLRDLAVWASYTYNPTRISAPGEAIDGNRAKAATHMVSAFVSYDRPDILGVTLSGRYVGSRFDDDLNSLRLDSFFLLDARLNRRLWNRSTAFLKVENLLDTEYEIAVAANGYTRVGGPRWVAGGIKVDW